MGNKIILGNVSALANAGAFGEPVVLGDVVGNGINGIGQEYALGDKADMAPAMPVVYGNTRQNLWKNPSGTSNGVTVTSNEDGTIAFEGSNASSSNVIFAKDSYALVPGTTYTIDCDNIGDEIYFTVAYKKSNGQSFAFLRTSSSGPRTAVFPSDSVGATMSAIVSPGATASGTYHVMLNGGSEAELWCPPGLNSVDELSLMTAGKNLLKFQDDLQPLTRNGLTFTPKPPSITTTEIDLQGHALCSLPDGTRDVLTVDANGARSIEKKVYKQEPPYTDLKTTIASDVFVIKPSDVGKVEKYTTNAYCNVLKMSENLTVAQMPEFSFKKAGDSTLNPTNGVIYVKCGSGWSEEQVQEWLNDNNAIFLFEAKTPQTIELDPIDPISMPINGNLWATSNIECEVEQGPWSKTPLEQTDALPYLWSRLTFDMDDDPDIQAYIVSKAGSKGDKGDPGAKGDPGNPGPGVAAGGTTGQMLLKKSDTDYDTEWSKVADITDFTDPKMISRLGKNAQQYVVPFSTTGQFSVSAWQWTEVDVEALWPADRIVDIHPMNYLSYDVIPFQGWVIGDNAASVYIMPFRASFYAGRFLSGKALVLSTVDINTTESSTGISFSGLIR